MAFDSVGTLKEWRSVADVFMNISPSAKQAQLMHLPQKDITIYSSVYMAVDSSYSASADHDRHPLHYDFDLKCNCVCFMPPR